MRRRGKLTHIIMPGPKAKAAAELRRKGYVVCWEQNYGDFFDFLNGGEPPRRMPPDVMDYIPKMTEDQYEGLTTYMAIVFCKEK